MITGEMTRERMEQWRVVTTDAPGLTEWISPEKRDCQQSYIYRLNLKAGERFTLNPSRTSADAKGAFRSLEMDVILISGKAKVANHSFREEMLKLDSFYLTGEDVTDVMAIEDCIFYIGAAVDEGYGHAFFRKFNPNLPIGDIHQMHGEPGSSGQREVFMTCGPEVEASRLLVGLTWSGDGTWTSWPPHQHEKELEETYCYFDMTPPHFGMQLAYIEPGEIEHAVVQTVYSGVFCMAPRGYHPTAASPGTRNAYVWIMCAHSHVNRRYDLAVPDPRRKDILKCEKTLHDELTNRE